MPKLRNKPPSYCRHIRYEVCGASKPLYDASVILYRGLMQMGVVTYEP